VNIKKTYKVIEEKSISERIKMLEINQKRRDQVSIIVNILDCARGGSLKTKIMHNANLSFVQLHGYLEFIMDRGLIRQTNLDGREGYLTTDDGIIVAQMYHKLLNIITKD
jgi:predicted transcriptional regulator